MNIINAPLRTVADRREVLQRIYTQLVLDPECRILLVSSGQYKDLTEAEAANWEARQTIVRLMREGQ